MDVDNGSISSDSDEHELSTPSLPYPSNLEYYPFGVCPGIGKGADEGRDGGVQEDGMMVDAVVEVGLRGPQPGQLHG